MLALPLPRETIYTPNNSARFLCLIKELCKPGEDPIFTLQKEKDGYESLQVLFINYTIYDPTESTFALSVFGDVTYWLDVRDTKVMKPYVEKWRREADVRRKALAYQAVINEVTKNGKSAFSAAKFLIDEPEKGKTKPARAKANETKSEAKKLVMDSDSKLDWDNLKDYVN